MTHSAKINENRDGISERYLPKRNERKSNKKILDDTKEDLLQPGQINIVKDQKPTNNSVKPTETQCTNETHQNISFLKSIVY